VSVFEAIELLRVELHDLLRERETAEEEQRRLQERLAKARKMEALGLLAGGVAHDLNNVLSGIVTYPDFLLMNETIDDETRSALKTIKRSGEQAAAIVNDLVTIARGVAVSTQPVLLDDVVEEYMASPQFERLKHFHPWVTVETDLAGEGVAVTGSQVHLRKVVMNLVSNATEAIAEESTGGVVAVKTSFRYVDRPFGGDTGVIEGEYSVLTVTDNGPGIPAQELQRIFEPFYTKKVMGRSGTGLGLTVVWNTVQDHAGFIDVQSSEQGTRFDLYFPVTRDPLERLPEAKPIDQYRGNGEHILVIDDVANQREIAAKMLSSLGYEVATAAGGEEAVEYLTTNEVDIVLLDMIMDPGINGRETYERIL
jgi:C4-dicarboxylate-specific signal transduction histidine kinase